MAEPATGGGENWERGVLERLVRSVLDEQRRARRWSILFKSFDFLYLFVVLFLALGWFGGGTGAAGKHTALVEINGVIAADSQASAERVNADCRMRSKTPGLLASSCVSTARVAAPCRQGRSTARCGA